MTRTRKILFLPAMVLCFGCALYVTQCRPKAEDNKTTIITSPATTLAIDTLSKPAVNKLKNDTVVPRIGIVAKNFSAPVDTLFVGVDSEGITYLGAKIPGVDFLRRRLIDSLITLKKQTGKYPNKIKVRTRGDVLMGARGAVQDVIQEAKDSLKIK